MLSQEARSYSIRLLSRMAMNAKIRAHIQEILRKLKSPITGQREFINENAVIEYAIKYFYDSLKKQRLF